LTGLAEGCEEVERGIEWREVHWVLGSDERVDSGGDWECGIYGGVYGSLE
jgi:hypothetical protein